MLPKGYDVQQAQNALEQSASQNMSLQRDDRLATVYREIKSFDKRYEITEVGKPKTWRLLTQPTGERGVEEAIFTVQGVIISKDLPPLREKPKIPVNRYKYLRQGVALSGLGSPTFLNALLAGNEIYGHFDRQFSEGILDGWDCSPADDNDFPCINISNRYLTPEKEALGLEDIPFHKGVDPQGILRNMARGDGMTTYIHTEDNVVQFFNTKKDEEGNSKFISCEPQMFRIGDIVQVQLSFVVIPIKGGHRKMLSVLRSLALLDGSFCKTSKELTVAIEAPSKLLTLKRRIGYDDVNDETERKKAGKRSIQTMEVDHELD